MKKITNWLKGFSLVMLLLTVFDLGHMVAVVEASEDDSEDEAAQVEDLPDYDFGGLTLKIGAPWDRTIDPNASERNEMLYDRVEMLEEKWNFTLEAVELGWDNYLEQYITSTLAGDPVADIVYILSPDLFPSLISNGIIYPVSDLDVIDYDDMHWSNIAKDASEYQGKYYSVTPNGVDNNRGGIFWNKTLFDELGLPSLYELHENGEWTWEKMMEIADQATSDIDNDGETDIFGFASQDRDLAWQLMYTNGHTPIVKTSNGIEMDISSPAAIEALEFYENVFMNYDHAIREWQEGDEWNYLFTEFANGNIAMISAEWWVSWNYFTDGRMQDVYGMVPYPTGPSYDQPVSVGREVTFDVMLATVEQAEEKLIIWDAIQNIGTEEDWERWMQTGIEANAQDRETVEVVKLLNENAEVNLILGFSDINQAMNSFFEELASGETTVQSGLEAIDEQVQVLIEEFTTEGIDLDVEEE